MSLNLRCVPSVSRNLILLQPFHPCTTISKAGAFIFNLQSCVLLTHHHWHSNRYCHPSNLYHSISYPSSLCFPFSASCDCYTSWFCTSLPFVKYWYLKLPFFSMGMRLKKIISHSVQGNLFVTLTFFLCWPHRLLLPHEGSFLINFSCHYNYFKPSKSS